MDIANIIYGNGTSVDRLKEYQDNLKIELNTQMVFRRLMHAAKPIDADQSDILMFPAYYYSIVSPSFGYLVIYMTDEGDLGWRLLVVGSDNSLSSDILTNARLDINPWTHDEFMEVCRRANQNELFIAQADRLGTTLAGQLSVIKSGKLSTYEGLDVAEFNRAVEDLDLLCIDMPTLRMQLPAVVQEIKDTLESIGVHVDSSIDTATTSSTPQSGTARTPVEQSTKEDLCKRMEKGEGLFTWNMQGGGKTYGYIIEIVYDYSAHKLRARTNDGTNGTGWVAFPNALRTQGAVYFVTKYALSYNGKNYRVSNASAITLIP